MAASVAERDETERAVMIRVEADAFARARAMPWWGLVFDMDHGEEVGHPCPIPRLAPVTRTTLPDCESSARLGSTAG